MGLLIWNKQGKMVDYPFPKAKLLRFVIFCFFLIFVLLLSGSAVLADDISSVADTAADYEIKKYNFFLLFNLQGLVGRYENLTNQKGDPSSPMEIHSAAGLCGELGFGFHSFGVSYYLEEMWSPSTTYLDGQGYSHGAGRRRHGIRASYPILHRTFHFIPEGGYVFLSEDASISDPERKKPDLYKENYKDEGYNYGLSGRLKLIPVLKASLWLYGRYVHDNLSIQADNYWIAIQFGGVNTEPPRSDKWEPHPQSGYLALGLRWTKRIDGRSEWFLTLDFSGAFGLF